MRFECPASNEYVGLALDGPEHMAAKQRETEGQIFLDAFEIEARLKIKPGKKEYANRSRPETGHGGK
jgi:hypothetical protein